MELEESEERSEAAEQALQKARQRARTAAPSGAGTRGVSETGDISFARVHIFRAEKADLFTRHLFQVAYFPK